MKKLILLSTGFLAVTLALSPRAHAGCGDVNTRVADQQRDCDRLSQNENSRSQRDCNSTLVRLQEEQQGCGMSPEELHSQIAVEPEGERRVQLQQIESEKNPPEGVKQRPEGG